MGGASPTRGVFFDADSPNASMDKIRLQQLEMQLSLAMILSLMLLIWMLQIVLTVTEVYNHVRI